MKSIYVIAIGVVLIVAVIVGVQLTDRDDTTIEEVPPYQQKIDTKNLNIPLNVDCGPNCDSTRVLRYQLKRGYVVGCTNRVDYVVQKDAIVTFQEPVSDIELTFSHYVPHDTRLCDGEVGHDFEMNTYCMDTGQKINTKIYDSNFIGAEVKRTGSGLSWGRLYTYNFNVALQQPCKQIKIETKSYRHWEPLLYTYVDISGCVAQIPNECETETCVDFSNNMGVVSYSDADWMDFVRSFTSTSDIGGRSFQKLHTDGSIIHYQYEDSNFKIFSSGEGISVKNKQGQPVVLNLEIVNTDKRKLRATFYLGQGVSFTERYVDINLNTNQWKLLELDE